MLLDLAVGEINFFPHPVKLIGKLISFLQAKLFDLHSFKNGLAVTCITIFAAGLCCYLLLYISGSNDLIKIYLLYAALSWRDLKDETRPILFCLMNEDLQGARKFLSRVVGRDTQNLSELDIIRAVIETISENCIDGVMSVMFFAWLGNCFNSSYGAYIFVWIFKAASTLDSMIGYKIFNEFGKSSAKLDDILNFFPARLGGVVIIFSGVFINYGVFKNSEGGAAHVISKKFDNVKRAAKIFYHDRLKHSSPNSAHGESAFAGVLNIKLGGGAYYKNEFISRPYLNELGNEAKIFDIIRAWNLLDISCSVLAGLIILMTHE